MPAFDMPLSGLTHVMDRSILLDARRTINRYDSIRRGLIDLATYNCFVRDDDDAGARGS